MCVGYVISFRLEVGEEVEVLSLCHQVATCKNDGTWITNKIAHEASHTRGKSHTRQVTQQINNLSIPNTSGYFKTMKMKQCLI